MRNINVLVDAYNLQIPQGTGIKTYTLNLIDALEQIGFNVSTLYGKNTISENSNSPMGKLAVKSQFSRLLRIWRLAKLLPSPMTVEAITPQLSTGFCNLNREIQGFNSDNCYDISLVRQKLFNRNSYIKLDQKIDVWHRTYPVVPILIDRCNCNIVTIHDLIPLKLPKSTLSNTQWFYSVVGQAIKESQGIITVSECSKQDILEFYDVDPDKIHVTYQAVNQAQSSLDPLLLNYYLEKYQLQSQKYFLFVGAIEPKKNLGRLIDAYLRIDTDLDLVIVGKKGWLWEQEIKKIGNEPKIKLLEYIDPVDLSYLYGGAYCLVFPSLYEGFGLPLLEAMRFGCPVITSSTSSLPEICGEAAIYADPYDVDSIRDKMELLLGDENLRQNLRAYGYKRVDFFSMDNYGQALSKAYTNILESAK